MKLTDSEIEILQIIWNNGPRTVREVNESQNNNRKVGYTTTLKIMQLMVEKNILSVDKEKRQHVYDSIPDQNDIKESLLNKFIEKTFQGSASSLVQQLLGNKKTSKKELEKIKAYIKSMEDNNEFND